MNAAEALAIALKPRSKHRNHTFVVNGLRFGSEAEYNRWLALVDMEKHGEIGELKHHPKFEVHPPFRDFAGRKVRAVIYEADSSYWRGQRFEHFVVEDVKGQETEAFKLKSKMFRFLYRETVFNVEPADRWSRR